MPDSGLTKKALAASMKRLMSERPFAKISVGDICEGCSMNRKSFYYHFQDKYDLVNWIFYTEFIENLRIGTNAETLLGIDKLCEYFYANKNFYVNALSVSGQNCFTEYFATVVEPFLMSSLNELFGSRRNMQFYITFFTDAFIVSIKRWLINNPDMPPKEYVSLLRTTITAAAEGIMKNIGEFQPK